MVKILDDDLWDRRRFEIESTPLPTPVQEPAFYQGKSFDYGVRPNLSMTSDIHAHYMAHLQANNISGSQ